MPFECCGRAGQGRAGQGRAAKGHKCRNIVPGGTGHIKYATPPPPGSLLRHVCLWFCFVASPLLLPVCAHNLKAAAASACDGGGIQQAAVAEVVTVDGESRRHSPWL